MDVYYFLSDWTHNQAYIGGYFWADGGVQQGSYGLELKTHPKDLPNLLKIREELKSTHKVSHLPRTEDKNGNISGECYRCVFSSKRFVQSLEKKFGIVRNKSNLDLELPLIPDLFFSSFSRGLLDGDGSVASTKNTVYWKGSLTFITQFRDRVAELVGLPKNPLVQDGSVWAAIWYHPEHLRKLYAWLYPPGDYLYGERKKELLRSRVESFVGKTWEKSFPIWNGEVRGRRSKGTPVALSSCIYCGAPKEWLGSAGLTRQGKKRVRCNFCKQKYLEEATQPQLLKSRA